MDQEKIGKFIAACRKENKLTQAALAEKLGISDRAVSKWENGKSLPDSSIMLELCDILSISVNDLLKGEKVMVNENNRVSEKIIVSLKKQLEEKSSQMLRLEVISGTIDMIVFAACIIAGIIVSKENYALGQLIIGIGVLILVAWALTGVWIEQQAGYYQCADCGYAYKPSYLKTLAAPHMGRSRKMCCPKCGKRNYHKKIISYDEEQNNQTEV